MLQRFCTVFYLLLRPLLLPASPHPVLRDHLVSKFSGFPYTSVEAEPTSGRNQTEGASSSPSHYKAVLGAPKLNTLHQIIQRLHILLHFNLSRHTQKLPKTRKHLNKIQKKSTKRVNNCANELLFLIESIKKN